jgi:2Fe-2S ferredoxin
LPKLIVTDRSGQESAIEVKSGYTVMEAIREAGFDELQALCGGCCSCATCHVIVDADWIARTGEPSDDEQDLLESSDHVTATSRLSCQIAITDQLDGLRVRIAEED